ncbi:MAG: Crp/Fnr family transcriptional regulator [Pseudomonadales bacterium]|jgi:CRP-like cAMP-binding protein
MEHRVSPATLARVESLSTLPAAVLERIAARLRAQRFDKGETIVRFNDPSRDFYLILSGSVRVSLVGATGRALTFQLLSAGEMFGEVSAVDGLPRTATVLAESESVVASLSSQAFTELATSEPAFAIAILERLARLNRRLTSRLFEYHAYDVRGRVYIELLRLWEDNGGEPIRITDRDMASRVGTTRENISRIHGALREQGLLERSGSRLIVRNPERIRAMLPDCEFG